MKVITNSKVFTGSEFIQGHNVFIEHGKITAISADPPFGGCEVVDAAQAYLLPGLIDLQIYGSGGNLFSAYPTAETLLQMDQDLLTKGTTAFLACVATNTDAVFYQTIAAAKAYRKDAKGFLGLHLEGPYLNPRRRGAHIESLIKKATLDEVKALLDHADGVVKMMTIAPELQDDAIISYLTDNGVIVSLGHSDATFDEATAAYNKGIKTTTHLFNAMTPVHHREPGIPTAVFNHNAAMASIIADGNHVSFEVVKFAQKLIKDRLFLITDAVTACNIGPYQHRLSGDKFVTTDGTLSGSNLTMVQAMKNCVEKCDISLPDAVNMASAYPAALMGLNNTKGKIAPGFDADILLIDEKLNLQRVLLS